MIPKGSISLNQREPEDIWLSMGKMKKELKYIEYLVLVMSEGILSLEYNFKEDFYDDCNVLEYGDENET